MLTRLVLENSPRESSRCGRTDWQSVQPQPDGLPIRPTRAWSTQRGIALEASCSTRRNSRESSARYPRGSRPSLFLRPALPRPNPPQVVKTSRRRNRFEDSLKQFMVLKLPEFRHQLQAFLPELGF